MSEVTALEVGQPAPRFSCLDSQGQTHDLESYMEQGKSVILYFYPRDSTLDVLSRHVISRSNVSN